MSEIVLWGHPDSGHACKVALGLALGGIPHKVRVVDIWAPREARPPEFLSASPLAEVPMLTIDGAPYFQSGAILLELGIRFGVLGGQTAAGLRRARELMMWEANRIGMCLPQLKGRATLDPAVVAWLEARYAIDCASFEKLLGDAPFFHGDQAGLGDCAIWGYAQWLPEAGVAPTPKMAAWIARMCALPVMKTPAEFFA